GARLLDNYCRPPSQRRRAGGHAAAPPGWPVSGRWSCAGSASFGRRHSLAHCTSSSSRAISSSRVTRRSETLCRDVQCSVICWTVTYRTHACILRLAGQRLSRVGWWARRSASIQPLLSTELLTQFWYSLLVI